MDSLHILLAIISIVIIYFYINCNFPISSKMQVVMYGLKQLAG